MLKSGQSSWFTEIDPRAKYVDYNYAPPQNISTHAFYPYIINIKLRWCFVYRNRLEDKILRTAS